MYEERALCALQVWTHKLAKGIVFDILCCWFRLLDSGHHADLERYLKTRSRDVDQETLVLVEHEHAYLEKFKHVRMLKPKA